MNFQANILEEKELDFQKTASLLQRRKAIMANGVGVFCPTTIIEAKSGIITDADGNRHHPGVFRSYTICRP